MRKTTEYNFLCKTCGEKSITPPMGSAEDKRWRQAWQEEGRVACYECLGVFHHGTITVIDEVKYETDYHPRP